MMNEPITETERVDLDVERAKRPARDEAASQWQGYDIEILNAILDGGGAGSWHGQ